MKGYVDTPYLGGARLGFLLNSNPTKAAFILATAELTADGSDPMTGRFFM